MKTYKIYSQMLRYIHCTFCSNMQKDILQAQILIAGETMLWPIQSYIYLFSLNLKNTIAVECLFQMKYIRWFYPIFPHIYSYYLSHMSQYNISLTDNIFILNYNSVLRKPGSNVNVSFHRFENQGRHSVHMHMLFWLKSLINVNVSNLRATIPDDHTYLAYLVRLIFIFQNIYSL